MRNFFETCAADWEAPQLTMNPIDEHVERALPLTSIERLWSNRTSCHDRCYSSLLAEMSPLEIRSHFGSHFECR
jgi:hypothetical protein